MKNKVLRTIVLAVTATFVSYVSTAQASTGSVKTTIVINSGGANNWGM